MNSTVWIALGSLGPGGRAGAGARVGSSVTTCWVTAMPPIYTDVYDVRLDGGYDSAVGHREELLAAARRLLEERGYAHITARDLVAASGTNLASIGYHFGSKAALLNAAIEASFADWAGQLADFAMSDPAATPLQRAGATWAASLASLPERRPILQSYIEALAQAMRVPELRAQLAAHYSRA